MAPWDPRNHLVQVDFFCYCIPQQFTVNDGCAICSSTVTHNAKKVMNLFYDMEVMAFDVNTLVGYELVVRIR